MKETGQSRWEVYQYGTGDSDWAIREAPGGGRTEYFPSILTWLTEDQAKAIAAMLNDMCGYNWQSRYPDWINK